MFVLCCSSFQLVYSGPAHAYKVSKLTEVTSYDFRIYASNVAGSGPYSEVYTFTTTKAPPPALKGQYKVVGHTRSYWTGRLATYTNTCVYWMQYDKNPVCTYITFKKIAESNTVI